MDQHLVVMIPRLDRYGGQEKSTLEVLHWLAINGWRITLYSRSLGDWPKDVPIEFHKIPVAWLRIQLLINIAFSLSCLAIYFLKWRKRPVPILTIGAAAPIADVRVIQFLHLEHNRVVAAGHIPLPNATSHWRQVYQKIYSWWEARAERRCLPISRLIISISHRTTRVIQSHFSNIDCPITTIHHGTDAISERQQSSASEQVRTLRLVFVGALERKGIEAALRYLSALKDVPWQFTVVGGGDQSRWRSLAHQLAIQEQTLFVGAQPADTYFSESDILLLPTAYEPFGLVVTEAVSHGLIPIASSESGAMELWPSRPEWLRLSITDPDERWVKALRLCLESPQIRKELSQDAQNSFRQWDWPAAANAYAKALKGVKIARRSLL